MPLSRLLLSASAALLVTMLCAPAQATDYAVGYVGSFDVLDDNESLQLGGEYRAESWDYGVRPTVGVNVTTDAAVYAYAGINWDITLADRRWNITPNFMVGGYHQGDDKDLGHGLEFRSGIEVSYELPNTHRIGVAFNHISNAGIGDKNPGAETLLLNYQVPTAQLLRR